MSHPTVPASRMWLLARLRRRSREGAGSIVVGDQRRCRPARLPGRSRTRDCRTGRPLGPARAARARRATRRRSRAAPSAVCAARTMSPTAPIVHCPGHAFSSARRRATAAADRASSTAASASPTTEPFSCARTVLASPAVSSAARGDLLRDGDDASAVLGAVVRHERRVGGDVLVGELGEARPERLGADDGLLVTGEARRQFDERGRERRGQRGCRTTRRRRRALAERREHLADGVLTQRHGGRTARATAAAASGRGSSRLPSRRPSSPARRYCRS